MAYVKTTWVAGVTVISAARQNNLETQYDEVIAILTTRGDIIYRGATSWERLAAGTAGRGLKQGANDPEWTGMYASTYVKTSAETVNDSTVLQNDDDLVAAVAASTKYIFKAVLYFTGNVAADIKFAFTTPASITFMRWSGGMVEYNVDGTNLQHCAVITASGTAGNTAAQGATETCYVIHGILSNGINAGNLQLQWAQQTANASDTDMLPGSHLIVWEMA